MIYRNATREDAAELAALARRTFAETFGDLYDPADLAAFLTGHSEAAWAGELAEPGVAVRIAEHDGRAVGYAKIGAVKLPVTAVAAAVELRSLYVLAPYQGGGHAQALMDWAIAMARASGAGELFLSVYVDNHRAKKFYARYGFEDIGRYSFMVGRHEDEDRLMRLVL